MGVTRLNVVYNGWGESWLMGVLAESGPRLLFEYSQQAAQRGIEFSPLHAPLPRPGAAMAAVQGPRHAHGLPGFIADALPDGWGMLLMDRAFRRQGRDPRSVPVLERLAVVGPGAMGALSFEPAEDSPIDTPPDAAVSLAKLAAEVQQVLQDEGESTPQAQLLRLIQLGGSPQGARPKALLRWQADAQRFSPAESSTQGEPWLVKFPAQGEHPEVCALEELYARLAREGGIDMPASRYFALGSRHSAFGVRRFDRLPATPARPGAEQRVPVLSLAALLEADFRLPSLDYEALLLATQRLTGDYRETLKAFGRCVFNVLAHNRDDHAKNFAFCLDANDRWKLSPAFDLCYSSGPGGHHTTSVAGEGMRPSRAQLLAVARRGGVREKDALACLSHWLDALYPRAAWLEDLPIRKATLQAMRRTLEPLWAANT